ncbi:hypothetical protein BT93_E1179 [Corymbia citriodora subsp. variegata]|nr:hypothetical protein BT93_E1179 [Corymbia citriodora subsp. variegata]
MSKIISYRQCLSLRMKEPHSVTSTRFTGTNS